MFVGHFASNFVPGFALKAQVTSCLQVTLVMAIFDTNKLHSLQVTLVMVIFDTK